MGSQKLIALQTRINRPDSSIFGVLRRYPDAQCLHGVGIRKPGIVAGPIQRSGDIEFEPGSRDDVACHSDDDSVAAAGGAFPRDGVFVPLRCERWW